MVERSFYLFKCEFIIFLTYQWKTAVNTFKSIYYFFHGLKVSTKCTLPERKTDLRQGILCNLRAKEGCGDSRTRPLFLREIIHQFGRQAVTEGRPDNARLSLTARSIWRLLRMRQVRSPGTVNRNSSVNGIRDIRYHRPFKNNQFILYLERPGSVSRPTGPDDFCVSCAKANQRCG
jgi:hypothetical protein